MNAKSSEARSRAPFLGAPNPNARLYISMCDDQHFRLPMLLLCCTYIQQIANFSSFPSTQKEQLSSEPDRPHFVSLKGCVAVRIAPIPRYFLYSYGVGMASAFDNCRITVTKANYMAVVIFALYVGTPDLPAAGACHSARFR